MGGGPTVAAITLYVQARPLLNETPAELELRRSAEWHNRAMKRVLGHECVIQEEQFLQPPVTYVDEAALLKRLLQRAADFRGVSDTIVLDISCRTWRSVSFDSVQKELEALFSSFGRVLLLVDSPTPVSSSRSLKDLGFRYGSVSLKIVRTTGISVRIEENPPQETGPVDDFVRPAISLVEDTFRARVIRGARRFLGHYELPSGAHVRTHYDLLELAEDDAACAYLRSIAQDLKREANFSLLASFGLGSDGLAHLAYELAASLGVGTLYFPSSRDDSAARARKLAETGIREILLFSDVLLTSSTASKYVTMFREVGAQVTGILAVVGLSNSKDLVAGVPVRFATRLHRPYFSAGEPCRLCQIGYPKRKVSSPDDLRQVGHVTAFDFWEMVEESHALSLEHSIQGQNHYLAWVDTDRILKRYDRYIASVLAAQLKKSIGESAIDLIVCPHSDGALRLAYALASSFGLSSREVTALEKKHIYSSTPSGSSKLAEGKYDHLTAKSVLLVDDGTNSLRTFDGMKNLVTGAGALVAAFAVFLNRLGPNDFERAESRLGSRFAYFYHWLVPPHEYATCPVCRGALREGADT